MASRTEVMSLDHDDDIDVNDPAAAADFPAPSLVTLSRDDADRMLAQDLKFLESCAEKAAAAGAPADAAAASAFASCLDHRDVPMTERVSWLYWHAHKPQWFHLRNFSSVGRTSVVHARHARTRVLFSRCYDVMMSAVSDQAQGRSLDVLFRSCEQVLVDTVCHPRGWSRFQEQQQQAALGRWSRAARTARATSALFAAKGSALSAVVHCASRDGLGTSLLFVWCDRRCDRFRRACAENGHEPHPDGGGRRSIDEPTQWWLP